MATVNELLRTMGNADVIAVDEENPIQYLIDNTLRVITIPSNGVVLGVEGDKDVNVVKFKMPRHYKQLDLSEFDIRINYVTPKAALGYFTVTTKNVEEDYIYFEWLVGAHVVQFVGSVQFAVTLTKFNGKEIDKRFNTTIGKANVLDGLAIESQLPDYQLKDLLKQVLEEVRRDITPIVDEAKQAASDAAKSAEESAESAKQSAVAQAAAEVAQEAAETAQNASEVAQTASELAQQKSEIAQGAAELAQQKAEEAQKAAEDAKESEETARRVVEQAAVVSGNILTGTKKGVVAHVDDAYPSKLLGATIYGETIQNLWVPGSTVRKNGITFTVQSDGGVHVEGTSEQQYVFMDIWVEGTGMLVKNQTYTLSGWSNNIRVLVGFFTTDTTNVGELNPSKPTGKVVTTTEKVLYRVGIYTQGLTVDEVIYPSLVLGDKPKVYTKPGELVSVTENLEMEVAGRNFARIDNNLKKIPGGVFSNKTKRIINPGEYVVGLTFNNYVDENRVTKLIFENDGLSFKTNNASYGIGIGIDLVPGVTYTFSTVTNNEHFKMSVSFYLNDGTFILYHEGGSTFTVPINAERSVLIIRGVSSDISSQTVSVSGVQIEVGNKVTSYKPYATSSNIPVDIQSNTLYRVADGYGDKIVIDESGNVSLIKRFEEVTDLKFTEGGFIHGSVKDYMLISYKPTNDIHTGSYVVCDKYPYSRGISDLTIERGVYRTHNAIIFFDKAFTDAATAVRVLTEQNPKVICEVSEQIIPLGKIDLPQLPEIISNVHVNTNIPTECEIEYVRDVTTVINRLESAIAKNALDIATK